jgi:hypothetical protein
LVVWVITSSACTSALVLTVAARLHVGLSRECQNSRNTSTSKMAMAARDRKPDHALADAQPPGQVTALYRQRRRP